jgi:predicted nucleic acid-binding protein
VKVYIDTNVVVARSVAQHEHQARAVEFFNRVVRHHWTPAISTHGLAEIYSILTRVPFLPRISPAEALEIVERNVIGRFEIESLTRSDYIKVIRECAAIGWIGGRVYDAIHIHVARKAQCERIYTFNVQDFRQIAPDLVDRIMAP